METFFVVNADDFGLCPEVNQGILAAHSLGIVRSTSVMTNMPCWGEIESAHANDPELGVGLHVCLSEGFPVSDPAQVPSLVDADGRFHTRSELFHRLHRDRIALGEVAVEVHAQLQRLRAVGIHPDHWNTHQYVHLHPRLLGVLKRTLSPILVPCMRTHRRVYVGARGWLRGSRLLDFYRRMPLRLVKDLYFRHESRRARRAGFRLPDGQLTRVPFAAPFALLVDHAAANAPAGVYEWICHPATSRRPGDKTIIDRPGELALLTRPGLEAELAAAGIRLGNFAQAFLDGRTCNT